MNLRKKYELLLVVQDFTIPDSGCSTNKITISRKQEKHPEPVTYLRGAMEPI